MIERIRKRDGSVVEFQTEKIALAISKAFRAVGREEEDQRSQTISGGGR
ncbi:ATP cone domain-containing protein [Methanothrix sp.]